MPLLESLGMSECSSDILDVIEANCPNLECIDLFYSCRPTGGYVNLHSKDELITKEIKTPIQFAPVSIILTDITEGITDVSLNHNILEAKLSASDTTESSVAQKPLSITLLSFSFDTKLVQLITSRGAIIEELILDHLGTPLCTEMVSIIGKLCPNVKILSLITTLPSTKQLTFEFCTPEKSLFNNLVDLTCSSVWWDPNIILTCLAYASRVTSITLLSMDGELDVMEKTLQTLFAYNPLAELEDIVLQQLPVELYYLTEATFRHFYERCPNLKYIHVGESDYISGIEEEIELNGLELEIDVFEVQDDDLYNCHLYHTEYKNPKRKMRSREF